MKKETKDFILDLRNKLLKSNIKDACLNFMKLHPGMFSDTLHSDSKVMSINMSVCICAKEEDIAMDPGFITIDLDKDNSFSEHFHDNRSSVYWNNEQEEDDVQD